MNDKKGSIESLIPILADAAGKGIRKIILSSPLNGQALPSKINIEPHAGRQGRFFQFALYAGAKVTHKNVSPEAMPREITDWLIRGFRQCDIQTLDENLLVLANRSHYTLRRKKRPQAERQSSEAPPHNRPKQYILQEGQARPWLIRLGLMTKEGHVAAPMQKKFRQINRYLEMVADVAEALPTEPTIVDFGCGKSYLTFALYDYLESKGYAPRIIGLDLKEDVIAMCAGLAREMGFTRLSFQVGDVGSLAAEETLERKPDMVVTLHACDTATDYALYHAVRWGSKVILSVPCCQHELFAQVGNESLWPLLKHGILKERFSALLTDGLRAALLEMYGYKCQVMEFIDSEHTAKNILIRAVKTDTAKNTAEAEIRLQKALDDNHVIPTLYRLLTNDDTL